MLGQYDAAIEAYQDTLSGRPGWREAEENLQIAILRKQALANSPGNWQGNKLLDALRGVRSRITRQKMVRSKAYLAPLNP